ncbi:MAG: signal peptidase II [Chloroflexi bacterium]|nr:signal peptidase II [Chloroflexota bacterium]
MERIEVHPPAVAAALAGGHTGHPSEVARLRLFTAIAVAVVALDQATKAIVRGWLDQREVWPDGFDLIRITHVENSGAAFGILQGAGPLLIVSSLVGVAVVIFFLRSAPAGDRLYSTALALILGGAVGNLIDRLLRGEVTDFIDPTHYPAFNLADSAIVVGVCALILLAFRPEHPATAVPDEASATDEAQ